MEQVFDEFLAPRRQSNGRALQGAVERAKHARASTPTGSVIC